MPVYIEQPEIFIPCDHLAWKFNCPDCKKPCDGTGIRFAVKPEGGVHFAKAPRVWCVDFYGSFCSSCNLLVLNDRLFEEWKIGEVEKRQIEIQFRKSYYFPPLFTMRFQHNEPYYSLVKDSDVPNPKNKTSRISDPDVGN